MTYSERQRASAVKAKEALEKKGGEYPAIITALSALTDNEEAQDMAESLQKSLEGVPSKVAEIDAFITDLDD